MTILANKVAVFLVRATATVIWSLILSKLIRSFVWPLLKKLWHKRPEAVVIEVP